MFDFDLAEMYGTETAQLKRAVRRNIERFEGDDFMFEVTRDELSRCQLGTLNKGRGSNFKYLPFAFTELGVAMLSSVLHSKTAIEINRSIMRAFVALRQMLATPAPAPVADIRQELNELREYIEEVFADYNDINEDTRLQLELINQRNTSSPSASASCLSAYMSPPPKRPSPSTPPPSASSTSPAASTATWSATTPTSSPASSTRRNR